MVEENICEKLQIKCTGGVTQKRYGFGIRHIQMMCTCICMIMLFMCRSSLAVAILAMTDASRKNDTVVEIFEWDKKTQGIILSSFFWGYTLMQIPVGYLAKRFGGKPILLVSLLANGILCLLLPTVASFGGWIMVCACRVAMGLTQACLFPATHTILGTWLPASERTAFTGFVFGGSQIGTIIAMPVSGLLAETRLGWKLIFYGNGAILLVTSVFWYWFAASSPAQHRLIKPEEREYIEADLNSAGSKTIPPVPWREILTTVPLWAIAVSHVGVSVTFTLFFMDLPTYLEKAMHISLKNSAVLSAIPYIGMWVGTVFASNLCEIVVNRGLIPVTLSRKIFNSIALFGGGIGLIILAFLGLEQKTLAIITVVAVLTLTGCTSGGMMVNFLDLSPQYAGVMLSISNFFASLGAVATPVITGFILGNNPSDVTRWRIVFCLIAATVVGCNIVYLIFGKTNLQDWDHPDYKNRRVAKNDEIQPVLNKDGEKEKAADVP